MNLTVSIITINFNNAGGLRKTIASVVSQSYPYIEYIVIDGGSTDGSREIIDTYAGKLAYWVSEADRGIYHAMNKGITKATGNHLLFLNSGDTLINPAIISEILTGLSHDIVYGNLQIIGKKKLFIKNYPDVLDLAYFAKESLPHPACFIRRSVFEAMGDYKEEFRLVSDWAFVIEAIFVHKFTYKHINFVVSEFSLDGLSSDVKNYPGMFKEKKRFLEKYLPGEKVIANLMLKSESDFVASRKYFIFKLIRNKMIRIYKNLLHAG